MSRSQIEQKLLAQPWFDASDHKIRNLLLSLPETPPEDAPRIQKMRNCDGFLADLAARPLEGGGVRHLRIVDTYIPNLFADDRQIFGILVNFEVLNIEKNAVYPYQYVSWRQGPDSGSKGVVLVRSESTVTHIICLHGFSFAVGTKTFDCFGGFGEGLTATDDIKRELDEEIGLNLSDAREVTNLGRFHPDRGMTNNMPRLNAVVFTEDQLPKIERFKGNPDIYEMRSGPIIIPVDRLWTREGFGFQNDDGYFGMCMWRLTALGAIKPPPSLRFDFKL